MKRTADGGHITVVHNRYRSTSPSGEDQAVDREVQLLRDAGISVSTMIRSSDEIEGFGPLQRALLPTRPFWSPTATRELGWLLDRRRPHVLHLHNPYPLLSPAVIRTARRRGIAVVQTVHNYRHSCLNGLHVRNGVTCTDCIGRRFLGPGVLHGCYRGSRPQSATLAAAERFHESTWALVDRFLALSRFTADHLARTGIPRSRIRVKPNHVDDPGPPTPPGEGLLFAGRLEEAKGVRLLLEAWRRSGLDGQIPLIVAGDGPLREELRTQARQLETVTVIGQLTSEQLADRYRRCAAVVVPSLCFEGLPGVVLEAFAHGRPVIGTRTGALTSTITPETGYLVDPDPTSLAEALRQATTGSLQRGRSARSAFEKHYRGDRVLRQLLQAYQDVVAEGTTTAPPGGQQHRCAG